jgi:hydrogenase expression/formation protein HypE
MSTIDLRPGLSDPTALPDCVVLAHGGGGALTHHLIETVFRPAFSNPALDAAHDGATITVTRTRLAFTTDTYVVRPLFFRGGSIGDLAVNGTVNDLAMCGARPVSLSAAFILEEGLPMADLVAVVASMRAAACAAAVPIVTGDTKVVERGRGDGIFITTTGIGVVERKSTAPGRVRPGDVVIVSGDLGSHGVAVLLAREGFELDDAVSSDTAPLWPAVEALLTSGIDVHCLRDLTRGGLASALTEIAATAGVSMTLDEPAILVRPVVRSACELFGLDPLSVANGGRFVAIVAASDAPRALDILRRVPISHGAAVAGLVEPGSAGLVRLRTLAGESRALDGGPDEQLLRIW